MAFPIRLAPVLIVAALAGAVAATQVDRAAQPPPAPAEAPRGGPMRFQVDGVHSSMFFRIRHMGVAHFYGRFNAISGHYAIDPDDPSAGEFHVEMETASVDTNNSKRDEHLRSADFFDAAAHPTITFHSTAVRKVSDDLWRATGDLTLHGVTRQIGVDMRLVGMKDTPQGYKSGFDAVFTVKRSDFGMTTYLQNGGLGDEVQITLALEGRRQ
jgi:polyisoprenoid-binding protein YceI